MGKAAPYTSFLAHWLTHNPLHIYIRAGFVAMPSLCAVSGCATMPWQPTVIPAVHLVHASSPSSFESYLPSHLVTSRPTLFCVAGQIHSVFGQRAPY
jgi:hypothetical protein